MTNVVIVLLVNMCLAARDDDLGLIRASLDGFSDISDVAIQELSEGLVGRLDHLLDSDIPLRIAKYP